MTGWRLALRMARREVLRSRGRSILALAMIALPVLAVTAADVLIATQDVDSVEGIERRIGAADAEVSFVGRDVHQAPDPDDGSGWQNPARDRTAADDLSALHEVLGADVSLVERRDGDLRVRTDEGTTGVDIVELDLREPATAGLFDLTRGRLPSSPDEAVVTPELGGRGPGIGEDLEVVDGRTLRVVGVVEHASYRHAEGAVSLVGGFGLEPGSDSYGISGTSRWLVDADGAVTWDDVRALNRKGALVVSESVLRDPPPVSE